MLNVFAEHTPPDPTTREDIQRNWRRPAGWLLAVVLLAVVAYYVVRVLLINSHAPVRLLVYGFSTQEEVFTQEIFPEFERAWEAETGRDLTMEAVFGPSGTLAGQINLGAPADVALFSNVQHANWLKVGRRMRRDTEPIVFGCTPMAILTRPGNPASIEEYSDLAQEGLLLLHADPKSSGGGQWAVLAEYGSELLSAGDTSAARAQLKAIWRNVRLMAPSARSALTLFELGAGDALVTYEQDARLALERGVPLEVILPPHTIVAQPVAVIVDGNVTAAERPAAEAFLRFLSSEKGQQLFERSYMRRVDCQSTQLPRLVEPFSIEDLGGWSKAYTELVDALWQTEIEPELQLEAAPTLRGPGEQ